MTITNKAFISWYNFTIHQLDQQSNLLRVLQSSMQQVKKEELLAKQEGIESLTKQIAQQKELLTLSEVKTHIDQIQAQQYRISVEYAAVDERDCVLYNEKGDFKYTKEGLLAKEGAMLKYNSVSIKLVNKQLIEAIKKYQQDVII